MKSPLAVILALLAVVIPFSAQSAPDYGDYDNVLKQLKRLTDRQLIECLKEQPASCPIPDEDRDFESIAGALGRRKHHTALISAYGAADEQQRYYLALALWMIDRPQVTDFMRSIAFENLPEGQDNGDVFFPLDYLARHCDQRALARLNRKVNFDKSFPVGCMFFAPTVAAFGRCNYRPAAPNLVRSLHAACANISDAALDGLHKFFPHACRQSHSIEELRHCYENLLPDDQK
jgi:hypothetical protein